MSSALDSLPFLWPRVSRILGDPVWPPASDTAADRFVRECSWHGLLPLLFRATGLPQIVADALHRSRGWRRAFALRAAIFERALGELSEQLRGEHYVLLKGADYSERLYGSFELRPMEDIDILVPAERYRDVCRELEQAGLFPMFRGTPATRADSFYERAFLMGNVTIEVHQAFIQRARHRIDYAAVWSRVEPGSGGALRLADADAVAYQALGLAVDQFFARLIRYLDLWLMIRDQPGLVATAARRAKEWHAARAYYGAIRMTCRIFPDLASPDLETVLADLLSPSARRFLDAHVLPPPIEMRRHELPRRHVALFRKFALMDGLTRRVAFVASHLAQDSTGRLALALGRSPTRTK